MTTIIAGQAAAFTLGLQKDGTPVVVDQASTVTVRIFDATGRTELTTAAIGVAPAPGWASGQILVALTAPEASLPAGEAMLVLSSTAPAVVKRYRLVVETAGEFTRSTLFVKDIAVDRLRADSLLMAARGALPAIPMSDDYLWDKLRAAEAEMAHALRVPLVPTAFFPADPTAGEILALEGQPWGIDPGYDYDPGQWTGDRWGMIKMRQKPVQSVSRVRFAYPGGDSAHYDLPLDWLRIDKKYGMLQFVPSSTPFAGPLSAFIMQTLGGGRLIPLAVQIRYVAGLLDVHKNYPELIDAIMKKTSLKVVEDSFLPQSGSISADGLSQSVSNDMQKHSETVDRIINGDSGSNGGLMAAIHGVRMQVL